MLQLCDRHNYAGKIPCPRCFPPPLETYETPGTHELYEKLDYIPLNKKTKAIDDFAITVFNCFRIFGYLILFCCIINGTLLMAYNIHKCLFDSSMLWRGAAFVMVICFYIAVIDYAMDVLKRIRN